MNFEDHLQYIIHAHRNHSTNTHKAVRYWDMKTPYSIHPIWCAMTLLTETSLPEATRENGSLALLYHDILEDTTVELPEYLPERVRYLVQEMTFEEGSAQEMREIWSKESEVKLLKLYDKVSNSLDGIWMTPEKYRQYNEYVRRLLHEVEAEYGELNIVKIGRVIIG
ncbi:MAG: hypothetical protein HYW24_00945 [Candidatus Aenigmarchaeota archaeon]|nr:hypothetical protein [Candidatus Aenigmarchaeota archaeon]